NHHSGERRLPWQAQCSREISDDEHTEDVEGNALDVTRAKAEKSVLAVGAYQLEERYVRDFFGFLDSRERRGLHDLQTNIEADCHQQGADEQSYTPTPRKEARPGKKGKQKTLPRTHQEAGRNPDLGPAAVDPTSPGGKILDCHQHRAPPSPADPYALEDAQKKQHYRGQDPYRGV